MSTQPPCKEDPEAPHGFVRNASHAKGRYVCECEFWSEPVQEPINVRAKFLAENIVESIDCGDAAGAKATLEMLTALAQPENQALRKIVDMRPLEQDGTHGTQLRCQHCGFAWLRDATEIHSTDCAYIIAHTALSGCANLERPTPLPVQPAEEWFCEQHPEEFMGHGGCRGAGILECARIPLLVNLLRLSEQRTRETEYFRDDLARQLKTVLNLAQPPQPVQEPVDKGPWTADFVKGEPRRVFVESDTFKHDVRLYVNGDFATDQERLSYAFGLARMLNDFKLQGEQAQPPLPAQPDSYAALRADIAAWKQRQPLTKDEMSDIEEKVYVQTTGKGKPLFEYAKALIRATETAHNIGAKP